ncbi:MAG: response regulator [Acidimicrobiales bacterium]
MSDTGPVAQPLILVVEDEEAFVDALTLGLAREGFRVEAARDGAEALQRFAELQPDLVLLDLMLPRVSGLDVCRQIRQHSSVPIVMVTARSAEVDTVVGLEVGADDYVTKPYRMRELVARLRAVMRRTGPQAGAEASAGAAPESSSAVVVGDVAIDPSSHEVTVRGEPVRLPLKEFDLLLYLMENNGLVLSRDALIERVWGHDYVGDTKTLDVHVKRLRSKIEDEPSAPSRIVTIRGLGYKFERSRS